MIYRFKPIYKERIWGGQRLHEYYKREIPKDKKIGESWELVDREDACSELVEPDGKCLTLHDLWVNKRGEVFGTRAPDAERFPILLKLLDCVQKLSVQVHPPAGMAKEMGGEPKTEMWYFCHTDEDAEIYVGLKKGVTKKMFEEAVGTPKLAELLHTLKPRHTEDEAMANSMFLPSGRIHAIGAGNLIFEIQQNSDTTYRVDDWGRVGDDGKPRELHIEQTLKCSNFNDFEPQFAQPHGERVVECEHFTVHQAYLFAEEYRQWINEDGGSFHYHFLVRGELNAGGLDFKAGDSWLVSADQEDFEFKPGEDSDAELVTVQFGR